MEENILYIGGNVANRIFYFQSPSSSPHIEVLSKDTFCMKNKIYICICMYLRDVNIIFVCT